MYEKRMSRGAFLTGAAAMAFFSSPTRDALAASSWDPYLGLMMADQSLKAGALFGGNGALWAKSAVFPMMTAGEAITAYAGVREPRKLQAAGIIVGGVRYMFLTTLASGAVVGKKSVTSVFLERTNKALIIGLSKDGASPASVTGVGRLADQLKKMNF